MATKKIWSTKAAFLKFLREDSEIAFPVKMMQSNGRECLDRVANDSVFSDMVDLFSGDLPHWAREWSLTYSEGGQ